MIDKKRQNYDWCNTNRIVESCCCFFPHSIQNVSLYLSICSSVDAALWWCRSWHEGLLNFRDSISSHNERFVIQTDTRNGGTLFGYGGFKYLSCEFSEFLGVESDGNHKIVALSRSGNVKWRASKNNDTEKVNVEWWQGKMAISWKSLTLAHFSDDAESIFSRAALISTHTHTQRFVITCRMYKSPFNLWRHLCGNIYSLVNIELGERPPHIQCVIKIIFITRCYRAKRSKRQHVALNGNDFLFISFYRWINHNRIPISIDLIGFAMPCLCHLVNVYI